MRFVALLFASLGLLGLLLAQYVDMSFRNSATLVQLIDQNQRLIGKPILIKTPPEAKFTKGNGPNGSKFLPADQLQPDRGYVIIDGFLGVAHGAKVGCIVVFLLGILGWWFETRLQRNLRLAMIPYEDAP